VARTIIVGWDGATWDLLEPWAANGILNGVARLRDEGVYGLLRSTVQPLTAVAWTSFLTGCQPGKHGIYDFVHRVPGSYDVRLTDRRQRRVPGLWQFLDAGGRRVLAVNVPMMVPVAAINGILVGGIDAPDLSSLTVSPASFLATLHREIPGYRIAASEHSLRAWQASLQEMVKRRSDLLFYLRDQEPWDVLMVVFSATDMAQHIFWGHMDNIASPFNEVVPAVYRACDRILEKLLDERREDTTVLLMSDHGAGSMRGAIHLNRYLEQGGYLLHTQQGRKATQVALELGKRFLPAPVRGWLRHHFASARDRLESNLFASAFDWSRTEVYSLGNYGNLFFNLRGREPQGIVARDRLEMLTASVTEHLMALRAPGSGDRLVREVWPRHRLYHGDALDAAPDLIVEWADYSYEVRSRFAADSAGIFSKTLPLNDLAPETVLTATHRMDGVVAAVGPHVLPGLLPGANIVDLAPTLLHMHGMAVPAHMDGRVLPELTAHLPPPRYAKMEMADQENFPDLGAEEAAQVAARLRSLGYFG
jgi:predicted AlkP superfamily phosphohydrolase/phosphomutase